MKKDSGVKNFWAKRDSIDDAVWRRSFCREVQISVNFGRALYRAASFTVVVCATALAACGGGGGGGSTPPAPAPSVATPTPPPPALAGVAAIGGSPLANAAIVFSCGCTGQAGTGTTDGAGNYTLAEATTATPAAPSPTYTAVPGRNYIAVITAPGGAQAWDITFLGNTPAHNHALNATNTSDAYTTAAALYVFYNSISATKADAFDTWDFNTIATWVSAMKTTPISAETTLLNDIATAQANHTSLYPSNGAAWAPPGTVPNATIKTDLDVLAASAPAGRLPQQCNGGVSPCAVPTP